MSAPKPFEEEILLLVIDKGLLAIIVAVAVALLARSLEKLKSKLSWAGELLKQRLSFVKEIFNEIALLEKKFREMAGIFHANGDFAVEYVEVVDRLNQIEICCNEAAVLLSEESIQAVREFGSWVSDFPNRVQTYSEGKGAKPTVHSELSEFKRRVRQLSKILRDEFVSAEEMEPN